MIDLDKFRFDVEFLEEAFEFLKSLDIKTREMILENIRVSGMKNDPRLLKKIDPDIWEFRTRYKSQQYRLLAFWDKEIKSLMICTHGFVKKSQKIPNQELIRAKRIMASYFKSKELE